MKYIKKEYRGVFTFPLASDLAAKWYREELEANKLKEKPKSFKYSDETLEKQRLNKLEYWKKKREENEE